MALDDRKMKSIELLIHGEKVSDIAKLVNCSRQSIYSWLEDKEFKAEMDRQMTVLKSQIDKKILSKVEPLLDKLLAIALKSKSDKTALDACIYAINRIVGTPTTKTQEVQEDNSTQETINLDVVKSKVNNVVDLKKAK